MADNEESSSVSSVTADVTPKTFGAFRKSAKLYDADSVELIATKIDADSRARDEELDVRIVEQRTQLAEQITVASAQAEEKVAQAKTDLTNLIDEKIEGGGIHYMGVLETLAELDAIPAEARKHGRFWVVNEDGCTYIWTVPEPTQEVPEPEGYWKKLSSGGTIDLSNYYTKDQVYNKEEVDVIKNRANANEGKLAAIVAACGTLESYDALVDEEYTTDQIQFLVNKLLGVVKTIGQIVTA